MSSKRDYLSAVLLLVLCLEGTMYCFSSYRGYRNVSELRDTWDKLRIANLFLEKRNSQLEAQIRDWKTYPEALEELARMEWGYIMADEYYFFYSE